MKPVTGNTFPRQAVLERLEPSNHAYVPDEVAVKVVDPLPLLLHAKRFDVMIKYIYAVYWRDGIACEWVKQMYIDHLATVMSPAFREGRTGVKVGVMAYLTAFEEILTSIRRDGFNNEQSLIPVNEQGVILDGAHRVAACAALGRKVVTVGPLHCDRHRYPFERFITQKFPTAWADAAVLEYCRCNPDSRIAIVWPGAMDRIGAIRDAIRECGEIYYEKTITLRNRGAANLMKIVYAGHHWVGSRQNRYQGAVNAASKYFGPTRSGRIGIMVFNASGGDAVVETKRKAREFCGIGNCAIHINDHHAETISVGETLLNANSIHWLESAPVCEIESYSDHLHSFRAAIQDQETAIRDLCFDSGMVLAAYGLRATRDIDVLHNGYEEWIAALPSKIGSHNNEARHLTVPVLEAVYDPRHHFYAHGFKHLSLPDVYAMKQRRNELKDRRDTTLMRPVLRKCQIGASLKAFIRSIGLSEFYWDQRSRMRSFIAWHRGARLARHAPDLPENDRSISVRKAQGPPITGVVVTCNDEAHLRECLSSLIFCSEIVVVDLGSTDRSVEIATEMGARVVRHKWVQVVEKVRAFAVEQARTDWICFADPDMVFPAGGERWAVEAIENTPTLGIVRYRYVNYFLGKAVNYGRWGGLHTYPAILNRKRVDLGKVVHRGIDVNSGFTQISAPLIYVIRHSWADNCRQLKGKIVRYAPAEAVARLASGAKHSQVLKVWAAFRALMSAGIFKLGLLDGWHGVYLSYLAAWMELVNYNAMRETTRYVGDDT